jgi:hypothetical protein
MDRLNNKKMASSSNDNLQSIEDRVNAVRRQCIRETTSDNYRNASVKFLIWMMGNKRHLVTSDLLDAVEAIANPTQVSKTVKELVININKNIYVPVFMHCIDLSPIPMSTCLQSFFNSCNAWISCRLFFLWRNQMELVLGILQ